MGGDCFFNGEGNAESINRGVDAERATVSDNESLRT
jgi:hypothetical protein